jgi:diguanylate cyclase (GGDEF)-like protein
VLPGCDRTHALQSAERIRSAVAAAPVLADQVEIPVTISIGVTAVAANTGEKEVLAAADEALCQAKSKGRNRAAVL